MPQTPDVAAAATAPAPAEGAPRSQQAWVFLALCAVLAWTCAIYAPAQTGFYSFDDYPNLTPLSQVVADPTLDEALRYILHGVSSPTGRPLSLATFAAQAFDWPANPGGFIRVNLLLHLLNGVLLFWALFRLGRLMAHTPARSMWQSLAAVTLWLIAPLQATAVIYIVQRMTELSATFVFLGLLLYVIGRERATQPARATAGAVWMTSGVLLGGGVGVFAKENAALFPLLMLVLEGTLLSGVARPAWWRRWTAVFLVVPSVLLGAYLLVSTVTFADAYQLREFTLGERLMTQARVVVMYLHKLLLPWPSAVRLLYDDYPISRGLLDPWTTLASIGLLAGLLGISWKVRRQAPLWSFAVLWFLAAHVLESTVIPLELVFEHRNYQASVGIWFALAAGAPWIWKRVRLRVRVPLAGFAVAYVLLLTGVTWQITTLWGQPLLMSDWWHQKLPESKRARIEHVAALIGYGLPDVAARVVQDGIEKFPEHPAFYLLQVRVHCQFPQAIALPPMEPIAAQMRAMRSDQFSAIHLVESLLRYVEEDKCAGLTAAMIRSLVEPAFENPTLAGQRRNLLMLHVRVLRKEGRVIESLERLREAIEIHPHVELLVQGAVLELEAGRLDHAREYVEKAESDPRVSWVDRWSHRKNVRDLRTLLQLHEAERGPGAVPPPR